MVFGEVRVTAVADTPVLLLREAEGSRHLAVWITATGANAILGSLEESSPEYPSTHELLIDTLAALGASVAELRILDVTEGVFSAAIVVNGHTLACRVSDGVALALSSSAPILVADEVLEAAGVRPSADLPEADLVGGTDAQLERFRAFLDTISPDDFFDDGTGAQP